MRSKKNEKNRSYSRDDDNLRVTAGIKGDNTLSAFEKLVKSIKVFYQRLSILASSRYAIYGAFFILLLMTFVRYAEPLNDNDLWWHMEYGEYMVKNHTLIPDHTLYSWTVADPNWIYNTFISQIYFYLVYQLGGYTALHISHYLFFALIILLFLYYNRSIGQPLNHAHIFAIALIIVLNHLSASNLRPELFSHLFIVVAPFIYFYSIVKKKNIFYLYPLLFVVWVNTHGVFVFGLFFVTLAFIGELLNFRFFKKYSIGRELLKKFAISVLLSYIVLLINPYGIKWLTSIVVNLTDVQFMKQAMRLAAYQSIFKFAHPARYILVGMCVSYVAAGIYIWRKKRYFNPALWLINIVFMYISFKYGRSCYYYSPIWYFSFFYYFSSTLPNYAGKTKIIIASDTSYLKQKLAPILLVSMILFSSSTIHESIYYAKQYRWLGFGLCEYMPDKIADFLKKHKLEGPMYNSYEIGGFLLWKLYPDYKVFIDPRHGPYKKIITDENTMFTNGQGFNEFISKYPFKIAVVKLEWVVLVRKFFTSPDWKLVYFDESAALFAHKSVKLPDMKIDLGPERFRNSKAYDTYVYLVFTYANMNDFKSARYMLNLMKAKYNYGEYIEHVAAAEGSYLKYEEIMKRKLAS